MTDKLPDGWIAGGKGGKIKPAKKGEVRNKIGRPKGRLDTRTIIKCILDSDYKRLSHFDLTLKNKMIVEHLMEGLIAKGIGLETAAKVDVVAIRELLDRLDGKAKQTIETTERPWESLVEKLGGEKEEDDE